MTSGASIGSSFLNRSAPPTSPPSWLVTCSVLSPKTCPTIFSPSAVSTLEMSIACRAVPVAAPAAAVASAAAACWAWAAIALANAAALAGSAVACIPHECGDRLLRGGRGRRLVDAERLGDLVHRQLAHHVVEAGHAWSPSIVTPLRVGAANCGCSPHSGPFTNPSTDRWAKTGPYVPVRSVVDRGRCGQSSGGASAARRWSSSTTVGVGQRGGVAEVAALGDVAQQAAHDLAAAGLGQVGGEVDRLRLGDRADLGGRRGRAARRSSTSLAAAQGDVGDDRLAGGGVVGADDRRLGDRRVRHERRLDLGGRDAVARTRSSRRRPGRAATGSRRRRAWRRRRRSSGPGTGSSRSRR